MNLTARDNRPKISQYDVREPGPASRWWNFAEADEERVLYISGEIVDGEDEEDDDEEIKSTADIFRDELCSGDGNISVWINSPGGDMLTGAQIYNIIKDYKGKVTIKIDGLAASAASVIAMSGDEVLMSPVSQLMIHNPFSCAIGDSNEMKRAADMLNEVKESIIKQYAAKKKRSYYTITNALIANVLEYGKTGQAPRPFIRPAKVASEKAAISAMKAKFDEEVKKRGLK